VFAGIEGEFVATRYHSLVVERARCRHCPGGDGAVGDGEIMGLRHRSLPVEGVQFHPEALLTQHGHRMLQNFLEGNATGNVMGRGL
jgi:anthranilate synthase component 2